VKSSRCPANAPEHADTLGVVKRSSVLAVVVAAVGLSGLVGGCSGGVGNAGGATSCKDFLAMSNDDMEATTAKMLKERDGRNASTGDVKAERAIIFNFCSRPEKSGAKVSDVA
jgi:acid stress chaperone HdeA